MADPFTWGAIIMGAGAAIDGVGTIVGNNAAAKAERQNQAFYDEQAVFAQEAGKRNEEIFLRSTSEFLGNQTSAFAKAGVDVSGSALMVLADTKQKARDEVTAIQKEAELNVRTAQLRGEASAANADRYTNFWNNALPIAGGTFKAAGSILRGSKS
jgi:hypothetical protein